MCSMKWESTLLRKLIMRPGQDECDYWARTICLTLSHTDYILIPTHSYKRLVHQESQWSLYLVERPQDLLPGVRFEVPINDVRDHEAWSARFVGHRRGWGWRDATENLLQAPVIHRLIRGICTGAKKKKGATFIPLHSKPVCRSASWGRGAQTKQKQNGPSGAKKTKLNTALKC